MKKLGLALMIVFLIGTVFMIDAFDIMGGKSSAAGEAAATNSVTVSGEGVITIKPDIAYVQLGVNTKDSDANVAQNQNKDLMAAVIAALMAQGITDDDLTTVQYNIYQSYDYTKPSLDGQNPPLIYEVHNIVKITIKDINAVGSIIDAASKAGANVVNSVAFDSTKKAEVYLDALKLAMKSAEGKATALMSTFGKKPAEPFKVYESSYAPAPLYAQYDMVKAEAAAQTPIQSGELEIRANVSVEYQY